MKTNAFQTTLTTLPKNEKTISHGFFGDTYTYSFHDPSSSFGKNRLCFLLAGQGAAQPGMFRDIVLRYRILMDRFECADQLAKKNGFPQISHYILEPETLTKEELLRSRELCLFTLECGLIEVMDSIGKRPGILAGHSLGIFGCLVASGIISFEEQFDFLAYRETLFAGEGPPGAMIAINASPSKIEKILDGEDYYLTCYNSPSKNVISVPKAALERVLAVLKQKRIPKKMLGISFPFHTPLFVPIQKKLHQYLMSRQVNISKPQIPVYSFQKKLYSAKDFKKEEILRFLSSQVVIPVHFHYQVEWLTANGFNNFVEISPQRVLGFLVKDIPNASGHRYKMAEEILTFKKPKKKKAQAASLTHKAKGIFSKINKIIGDITGYKIKEISVEDSFQEELGLDSIKKAEIAFTILEEEKIPIRDDFNLSEISNIHDLVSYVEEDQSSLQDENTEREKAEFSRRRLVFKEVPMFRDSFTRDEKEKTLTFHVIPSELNREKAEWLIREAEQKKPDKIILVFESKRFHLESLSVKQFQEELGNTLFPMIIFFQTILHLNPSFYLTSLFLVTKEPVHPFVAGILSFFRSLRQEIPKLFVKEIVFQEEMDEKQMEKIIGEECGNIFHGRVLYKNNQRFVPVEELISEGETTPKKQSAILAIGGAKGITFSLLRTMAEDTTAHVTILGRSPEDEPQVRENIRALNSEAFQVSYIQADATNDELLEKIIKEMVDQHGTIDILINGAGIERSRALNEKTDVDIREELFVKVIPAFHLSKLSIKYPIKHVLHFTSIVSHYGNLGQTIYSCANEINNALADVANLLLPDKTTTAINWPPWDNVGMTANKLVRLSLIQRNISLLSPDDADKLFRQELTTPHRGAIYHINSTDHERFTFFHIPQSYYEPLIGKLREAEGEFFFDRELSVKSDPYLLDHKVGGACYLPASVGLAMFLCRAHMTFGQSVTLKGMRFLLPLLASEESVQLTTTGHKNEGNILALGLKTDKTSFVGEAAPSNNIQEKREVVSIASMEQKAVVKTQGEIYNEDALFHGKTFQSISKVFENDTGNLIGYIDNSRMKGLFNNSAYGKLAIWMDAAFQMAILTKIDQLEKQVLPSGVKEVKVNYGVEDSKILYLVPSNITSDSSHVTGDVMIVNEDGEALVEMRGVTLQ